MSKLDPQLEFLKEGGITDLRDNESMSRFGLEMRARGPEAAGRRSPEVVVLVECESTRAALTAAGLSYPVGRRQCRHRRHRPRSP